MKKQFVTYEIALKLKELGFNEECLACYTPHLGNGIFEFISKDSSNGGSGFNERFIKAGAVNGCSAPLWQQAIDFFREKHNIYIAVISYTNPVRIGDKLMFEILIGSEENGFDPSIDNSSKRLGIGYESKKFSYYNLCETYHDARENAILKAIELIKTKEINDTTK